MNNIQNIKNIVFHECPICKTSMEVELIEIRKELVEGQIDLEDVKKEWRHVCPKCDHETTKYIKICPYCNIPDDTDKLQYNQMEIRKEKAYYHAECKRKHVIPYIIFGIIGLLILAGAMLVGKMIIQGTKTVDQAPALVKQAKSVLFNPFPPDPAENGIYKERRLKAIEQCKEAIKINPKYSEAYLVLGRLYVTEKILDNAASTLSQGLKTAKYNKEDNIIKEFKKDLKELEKQGIKPKW